MSFLLFVLLFTLLVVRLELVDTSSLVVSVHVSVCLRSDHLTISSDVIELADVIIWQLLAESVCTS